MLWKKELVVPTLPPGSDVRPLSELSFPYPELTASTMADYAKCDRVIRARMVRETEGARFPETLESVYSRIMLKMTMLWLVRDFFHQRGFAFDEFNNAEPHSKMNRYFAYEFSALWLWTEMVFSSWSGSDFGNGWYVKYQEVIEAAFKKYPDIMGILSSELDLRVPGNKFLDFAPTESPVEGH